MAYTKHGLKSIIRATTDYATPASTIVPVTVEAVELVSEMTLWVASMV